jgi:hypothetical protein
MAIRIRHKREGEKQGKSLLTAPVWSSKWKMHILTFILCVFHHCDSACVVQLAECCIFFYANLVSQVGSGGEFSEI